MGVATEKHIRKPLYVDAVRVNAQNFDAIAEWCGGEIQVDEQPGSGTTKKYIKVRVHNPKNPRQTKAFIGDWLLYTERGYKVYTNKAFRSAFDPVEGEAPEIKPPTEQKVPDAQEIPKFYFKPHSDEITEEKPHKHAVPLTLPELMNIIRNELVDEELTNTTRPEPEPVKEELPPQPRRVGPQIQIDDKRTPEPVEAEESAQAEEDIKLVPQAQPGSDLMDPPPPGGDMFPPDDVPMSDAPEPIESPDMKEARETIEADGGTVEEATPQGVADAVRQNEEARLDEGAKEFAKEDKAIAEGKPETVDEIIENHPDGPIAGMSEAAGETPQAPPIPEQDPQVAAAGKRVLSKAEQDKMGPEAVRDLLMEGDVILEQDLAA